jgi:transcriptional regulator GlxA family with amidase domain
VLRTDADTLVDRQVPLDCILAPSTVRDADEQITAAPTGRARVARLERLAVELAHRATRQRSGAPDPAVLATVETLHGRDERVDELARRVGLSPRQLQRRFVRHVGYPPSQFARVARLQRFLARSMRHPDAYLAGLAASSGYADESHLARDCRAIAGVTPAEMRATVSATSHASPQPADGVRSVQATREDDARRSAA